MSYFPQPGPYVIEVAAERSYYWCACGKSAAQPFCDGSHKGTAFAPIKLVPKKSRYVYFCGCKQTQTPPFCDGSHGQVEGVNGLPDEEMSSDPAAP